MNLIKKTWEDQDGMGVVEVILITIVLIGLAIVFKDRIGDVVDSLMSTIESNTSGF